MKKKEFEIKKIELLDTKKSYKNRVLVALSIISLLIGIYFFVIGKNIERSTKIATYERADNSKRVLGKNILITAPSPTFASTVPSQGPLAKTSITLSPSPTTILKINPTLVGSPSPTPHSSYTGSEEPPALPVYSGQPLPASSSRKNLLVLTFDSDSDQDWKIDSSEGVESIAGKIGNGFSFNPGTLVLTGGGLFMNSGTLSFWIKIESEVSSGEFSLMNWNTSSETRNSSFSVSLSGGEVLFSIYDNNIRRDIASQLGSLTEHEWHYVVATWDLTQKPYYRSLYIDGEKVASGDIPIVPTINNPSTFQIGGTVEEKTSPRFVIDELVLSNWAKSEEEIAALQ